jgi:hypothetical protein
MEWFLDLLLTLLFFYVFFKYGIKFCSWIFRRINPQQKVTYTGSTSGKRVTVSSGFLPGYDLNNPEVSGKSWDEIKKDPDLWINPQWDIDKTNADKKELKMGIFDIFKKEIYINKLVRTYKEVYECDDTTSINTLRKNYTKDELKLILTKYKENNKQVLDNEKKGLPVGSFNSFMGIRENFFKEDEDI